jgi:hypothetical protein
VKKALLSLAVAGLALSAVSAANAQSQPTGGGQKMLVVVHPQCNGKDSFYPLAEAYKAKSLSFDPADRPSGLCPTIPDNYRWCGNSQTTDNTTAAPGAFALCTKGTTVPRLDVDKFVTCPKINNVQFGNAFVQSYRLTKDIPASVKCPGVFIKQQYTQFGSNIRTWWTLIYSPPGTTFTLDVTVRCTATDPVTLLPLVELHIDRWVWKVVVTFESLNAVIDVLHSNTLGTSEIPCIAAETMYVALKDSVKQIREAHLGINPSTTDATARRINAQNALFNMEALIIAYCSFGDCFFFTDQASGENTHFSSFPPSNDVQVGVLGMLTGVIDTPENPCCCKLLVDIENLAIDYGIVSP